MRLVSLFALPEFTASDVADRSAVITDSIPTLARHGRIGYVHRCLQITTLNRVSKT